MAIAVSGTAGIAKLNVEWIDVEGKKPRQTITLDPAITNTEVVNIFTYLAAMSYAGQVGGSIAKAFDVTGTNATPQNLVYPSTNVRLLMTFSHVDPDNAAKTLYRTVSVPAYRKGDEDTVVTVDGKPNTANTDVAAFIAQMELSLAGISHSGVPFHGSWTFELARSGTISVAGDMEA